MGLIQSLINVIFFLIIAVTVVGSVWLSRKYKERYADFPWGKAVLLIVIEVAALIIFKWLWANPLIVAIAIILLIVILVRKKKKDEQIL